MTKGLLVMVMLSPVMFMFSVVAVFQLIYILFHGNDNVDFWG